VATTSKRTARSLAAVVLAAGKGERLRSSTPKVLHPVCGRPLLWHALQVVRAAKPARIVVVGGPPGRPLPDSREGGGGETPPPGGEQAEQPRSRMV
jgi:CTP:molybdopterin cytidylyltransferase MocA